MRPPPLTPSPPLTPPLPLPTQQEHPCTLPSNSHPFTLLAVSTLSLFVLLTISHSLSFITTFSHSLSLPLSHSLSHSFSFHVYKYETFIFLFSFLTFYFFFCVCVNILLLKLCKFPQYSVHSILLTQQHCCASLDSTLQQNFANIFILN